MPEDSSTPPESIPQNPGNAESSTPKISADIPPEPATNQPGSVPPRTPRTQTPVSVQVEKSATDKFLGQAAKTAREFWQKAQPVLKEKSIQALRASNRFTNHFLDQTWPKLSAQAVAAVPNSAKAKVEVQKAKIQPTLNKLQPVWEKGIVPAWQGFVVPLWMKGLALLRQRLPIPLAQELTDRFLTILVIAVLATVYWFFSSLTSGKPAVAKEPAFPKPTATPLVTRPVPAPAKPSVTPKRAPAITAQPSSLPSATPTVLPTVLPSDGTAVPSASTASKPVLDLSELKTQLANSVASVDPDLVASVQSFESNHRLQATLGQTWFGLNAAAQDQVAQDLWQRSKDFDFDHFELRDNAGSLIARSPVVGNSIVVFQRKNAPEAD